MSAVDVYDPGASDLVDPNVTWVVRYSITQDWALGMIYIDLDPTTLRPRQTLGPSFVRLLNPPRTVASAISPQPGRQRWFNRR